MTTTHEAIVTGLAVLLDGEGIASWSPSGTLTGPGPVIAMAAVPESPDRVVTLTAYTVTDDPAFSDSTIAVQVRVRGTTDPRTTWATSGAVFDVLQAWTGDLGGVPVIECHRQVSAPLGQDGNRRWEQADTYYMQTHTPTRHRPF
ncbi:minor capsid protein [Brachybacterium sp. NPDC056505]|uniref:phage tail terminator protein n=1 Tax=Brachybacterium sp. NPDC056505 TaxID=3345843 RepID=UPI0036713BB8